MGKRKKKEIDYFKILERMETPIVGNPFLEGLRQNLRGEAPVFPPELVEAARELGVTLPTSEFMVRSAFNRIAAQRHPDPNHGVDGGMARAVEARDRLLRFLRTKGVP